MFYAACDGTLDMKMHYRPLLAVAQEFLENKNFRGHWSSRTQFLRYLPEKVQHLSTFQTPLTKRSWYSDACIAFFVSSCSTKRTRAEMSAILHLLRYDSYLNWVQLRYTLYPIWVQILKMLLWFAPNLGTNCVLCWPDLYPIWVPKLGTNLVIQYQICTQIGYKSAWLNIDLYPIWVQILKCFYDLHPIWVQIVFCGVQICTQFGYKSG
jgi:hypothetical protein